MCSKKMDTKVLALRKKANTHHKQSELKTVKSGFSSFRVPSLTPNTPAYHFPVPVRNEMAYYKNVETKKVNHDTSFQRIIKEVKGMYSIEDINDLYRYENAKAQRYFINYHGATVHGSGKGTRYSLANRKSQLTRTDMVKYLIDTYYSDMLIESDVQGSSSGVKKDD